MASKGSKRDIAAGAAYVSLSPALELLKLFHSSSSSMVLIKVVIVKKVRRDGFLKFAIVLCQLANMLNSPFRQVLSLIWGHVHALKTGMSMYRKGM